MNDNRNSYSSESRVGRGRKRKYTRKVSDNDSEPENDEDASVDNDEASDEREESCEEERDESEDENDDGETMEEEMVRFEAGVILLISVQF